MNEDETRVYVAGPNEIKIADLSQVTKISLCKKSRVVIPDSGRLLVDPLRLHLKLFSYVEYVDNHNHNNLIISEFRR